MVSCLLLLLSWQLMWHGILMLTRHLMNCRYLALHHRLPLHLLYVRCHVLLTWHMLLLTWQLVLLTCCMIPCQHVMMTRLTTGPLPPPSPLLLPLHLKALPPNTPLLLLLLLLVTWQSSHHDPPTSASGSESFWRSSGL